MHQCAPKCTHLLGAHAGEGALPLDLLGDRPAQRVLRRRLLVLQVPPQLQGGRMTVSNTETGLSARSVSTSSASAEAKCACTCTPTHLQHLHPRCSDILQRCFVSNECDQQAARGWPRPMTRPPHLRERLLLVAALLGRAPQRPVPGRQLLVQALHADQPLACCLCSDTSG